MNTYYTKCGIEFKKSTNASVTGYKVDESNQECAVCPFRLEVKKGWPSVFDHWECRAGSQKPYHKNEWTGELEGKNTLDIKSLDHSFMEDILQFCKEHPHLGAGYNQDLADCRRNISVSCSQNKKGIVAKKELIEKFFPTEGKELKESDKRQYGDKICSHCGYDGLLKWNNELCPICGIGKDKNIKEEQKVKQDGKTSTNACGKCSFGHWYSEENTYVSVVADDGIKTIKRPCEPHTHYCYQFADGQKKIAADKDFNPDTCPEWCPLEKNVLKNQSDTQESSNCLVCDTCSYRPVKGSVMCNRKGFERIVTPGIDVCGWYNNVKTGEMGPQQFEWNYEGSYPECAYKDFPDSYVKRIYYTIPEIKHPEDAKTVNDTTDTKIAEIANELAEVDTKTAETVSFDYSTVDADTARLLQDKAKNIIKTDMMSRYIKGQDFKSAHEKLAKYGTGSFGTWCKSIGYSDQTAYNHIKFYDFVCQMHLANDQIENLENIPWQLLNEATKPSAPKELQEQVLSGDITTHKQYKEKEAEWKAKVDELRTQQDSLRIEKQQAITRAFDAERKADRLQTEMEELQEQLEELNKKTGVVDDTLVSKLEDRIRELETELRDKPIEAAAVKVVEKVPEKTIAETVFRLYGTLLAAKLITQQDIQMVHDSPNFEKKMAIEEFLENLRDMIPGYLDILKDNVPSRKCEDCHYCEWEGLKEEDELKGLILCKFPIASRPQLWPNEKACSSWMERQV